MDIKCGVPQECILGPLLFIIYINDIVNVSDLAEFMMFADDRPTNIYLNNKSIHDLTKQTNVVLDKFVLW